MRQRAVSYTLVLSPDVVAPAVSFDSERHNQPTGLAAAFAGNGTLGTSAGGAQPTCAANAPLCAPSSLVPDTDDMPADCLPRLPLLGPQELTLGPLPLPAIGFNHTVASTARVGCAASPTYVVYA